MYTYMHMHKPITVAMMASLLEFATTYLCNRHSDVRLRTECDAMKKQR